jgi:hypothetical protein
MNPEEVLKDPQFLGLPQSEQSKVLFSIDPHFAALPEMEQAKVLSGLVPKTTAIPQTATTAPTYEDPMAAQAQSVAQFDPSILPSSEQFKQFGQDVQGLPGQFAKGVVEQLPIAGMVVGGALGAPAGPIGAVGGAGMGGAIGAGARGSIQSAMGWRTPPTLLGAMAEMGKEGMLGAGAEMAGPLLQPIANKIAGPFANYTKKVMAENALAKQGQQMVEQGIPISPDLISPSRTSKAVNWALDNLWPANSIMAGKRRMVYDAALQMKDSFAQDYGVGKTTKELTNKAWDDWAAMAGPDTVIPMNKTIEAIQANIDKPFATGAFWDKYAKTFAEGDITVQGIRDLLAVTKPTKAMGADKTARRAILDGLKSDLADYDLQAGTELAKGLIDAQAASRALARLQPIERILKDSITKPEGLDAGLFSPAQFVQKWEAIRSKVGGRLSNSDIKMVDDFAQKMQTMVPDISRLKKYETGQQIPFLSGQGIIKAPGTAAGMGALTMSQPYLILPIGAEASLAYSIMNPTGLARKFLTTGIKPPTMLPKMGAMKFGEVQAND